MRIIQGADIPDYTGWVAGFQKRDKFPDLEKYLDAGREGKVCALFGLRRTGKSVMMFQAILERQDSSAYILCSPSDTMDKLADEIFALRKAGVRHFFIDEATLVPNFIDECQFLADLGASGTRVVLSGTDSLSFYLASQAAFSGRMEKIRTTFIPFREHKRLLGTKHLDNYAQRGGILSDPGDFEGYPLSAIALNIQNSLENSAKSDFLAIGRLRKEGKLTTLIQQIVKDENHRFTLDAVRKAWKSPEFFTTRNDIQIPDLVRKIEPENLMRRTRKRLGISGDGRLSVSPREFYEINRYLQELELVRPALVITESDLAVISQLSGEEKENAKLELVDKLSYEKQSRILDGKWLFTQPGLRWSQTDALIREMEKDVKLMGARNEEIEKVFSAVRASAMGSLMEEIIVNETALVRKDAIVFKYLPLDGDIDMVVSGRNGLTVSEIKHSSSRKSGQTRHIRNRRNIALLEDSFGAVNESSVIYTGKPARESDIEYVNADDYLENLGQPEKKRCRLRERPA